MIDLSMTTALTSRRAILQGALALGATGCMAPQRARSAPAILASDNAAAWPAVAALMHSYVHPAKLPGLVATLGWRDEPLREIALGTSEFGGTDPVTAASLYRVYSMTKPVTGLLAAILIDEGHLSLDGKLADICPELANMKVAIDPVKGLESRPATAQITIRQLLTHTAGFGYAVVNREKVSLELLRRGLVTGAITRGKLEGVTAPALVPAPADYLRTLAEVPLVAEPGTVWRYSMGLDVLGMAMARLMGRPLDALFKDRIFAPAGMRESWFRLTTRTAKRLTTNYGFSRGIHLPLDQAKNSVYLDPQPIIFGGAGLITSPRDFDRFMRLLLNDGKMGGKQVVSAAAVKLATSNLLPAGASTAGTSIAGNGFGAGGRVGLGADEGTFGWSGAAGTVFGIQRRIGLRAALYAQFMPTTVYPLQRDFLAAARTDAVASLLAKSPATAKL